MVIISHRWTLHVCPAHVCAPSTLTASLRGRYYLLLLSPHRAGEESWNPGLGPRTQEGGPSGMFFQVFFWAYLNLPFWADLRFTGGS